jgi:hypothetical protein
MLLHAYKIRPREDKRGVDLISDALPFRSPVVRRTKRNQVRKVFSRSHCQLHRKRESQHHELRGDFDLVPDVPTTADFGGLVMTNCYDQRLVLGVSASLS